MPEPTDTLSALRGQIDHLDDQILGLLNQRMEIVRQIGHLKRSHQSVIYRPEREQYILSRLEKLNPSLLTRAAIEAIYLEIFAVSRNLEMPERIAFLGPEGSYSHQAAESRFGALSSYLALGTIQSVFEAVQTERARFGVVPIENNQEGTVKDTIELLYERDVCIVAEIAMPIHFAFASQEEDTRNIRRIYSKDIAFGQCRKFLQEYFGDRVELSPVASTSEAAAMTAREKGTAALCAPIAAKLYKVPVLFENIEDSPHNQTRFFILANRFESNPGGRDKTTLIARLPDEPGSLAGFLRQFQDSGINLTKVESRPAKIGKGFQYWFWVECEGHQQDPRLRQILDRHGDHLKILGSYVRMC